eukprot:Rhum_TRINITY_DN20662_c0_g1::Rhum_TRINITY_DN20662_c0_g1_i1::g.171730::m.171730
MVGLRVRVAERQIGFDVEDRRAVEEVVVPDRDHLARHVQQLAARQADPVRAVRRAGGQQAPQDVVPRRHDHALPPREELGLVLGRSGPALRVLLRAVRLPRVAELEHDPHAVELVQVARQVLQAVAEHDDARLLFHLLVRRRLPRRLVVRAEVCVRRTQRRHLERHHRLGRQRAARVRVRHPHRLLVRRLVPGHVVLVRHQPVLEAASQLALRVQPVEVRHVPPVRPHDAVREGVGLAVQAHRDRVLLATAGAEDTVLQALVVLADDLGGPVRVPLHLHPHEVADGVAELGARRLAERLRHLVHAHVRHVLEERCGVAALVEALERLAGGALTLLLLRRRRRRRRSGGGGRGDGCRGLGGQGLEGRLHALLLRVAERAQHLRLLEDCTELLRRRAGGGGEAGHCVC